MEQKHDIEAEIAAISPILAGLRAADVYKIPAGYFENLPDVVMAGISLAEAGGDAELKDIAPLLHSIPKKQVYSAPPGYFEQPVPVYQAPAKQVGMQKYKRWIQYAAAAVIGGLLVSGAFMFTDSKDYIRTANPVIPVFQEETGNSGPVNAPVSAAKSAVAIHRMALAKKIELISDDELQHYLEENATAEPVQLLDEPSEDSTVI